ncbi:MAG: DUF4131 domain-containing protein [Rubrobacter sp.]|nr:DUF4131 domain-containing protein [Rubrobacter sp.]
MPESPTPHLRQGEVSGGSTGGGESTGRLDLDLGQPVCLDLWALTLAVGIVAGTVVPPFVPALFAASLVVCASALCWRDLVPARWRAMAVLSPFFLACGVGIALLHAATADPLLELAEMEPGEVVVVGRIESPPVPSGFGYRTDVRVEHLWYEDTEVIRGGGVRVQAGDLQGGVGDRVRVDGEISAPESWDEDFDYARYLGTHSSLLNIPPSDSTPRMLTALWGSTKTSRRSIL